MYTGHFTGLSGSLAGPSPFARQLVDGCSGGARMQRFAQKTDRVPEELTEGPSAVFGSAFAAATISLEPTWEIAGPASCGALAVQRQK